MDDLGDSFHAAAQLVANAEALLIGAGAGMGVDSGLPDFRGNEGFWKAYPPFRGRSFAQVSTPHWFHADPQLAWGFFGHRLQLYRSATPHEGFDILCRWSAHLPLGVFVFTSNVDGQFQRAGFDEDRVFECHGSIHYLQCLDNCTNDMWTSDGLDLDVDPETIRCRSPLPRCPHCGELARPNILMFSDRGWNESRAVEQQRRYARWQRRIASARTVVIELGAGLAVPTVRCECELSTGMLIRINPREGDVRGEGVSLPCGALDALRRLDDLLPEFR